MWKQKSTRNSSFWDSSSSHQQNQTQQIFPSMWNSHLTPALFLLRNIKNHYLRSSTQLLPSFFSKTLRTTAFDLLKNPKLWSSEHGCWWLLKKNEAVGRAWVLMVAWEEWNTRMTTPLQNSLRLEFYMDYNFTSMLPHKTWVSKTQILHETPASKAQDAIL